MRPAQGHIERVRRAWYLRHMVIDVDAATGLSRRVQKRVRLGSVTEIRSHAAAREIADRWIARTRAPTLEPGMATTFREFSARFEANHVPLLRASTQKRYRSVIRALNDEYGGVPLEKLDAPRIQAGIANFARRLAPSTIHALRSTLLHILRLARRDGYAAHAIVRRTIQMPRSSEPIVERRSFSEAELARIIEAAPYPWRMAYGLMGYAGLRIGEALGLEWRHIDLERGVLRISQAAADGVLTAPKTMGSVAAIPMLPELKDLLRRYRTVWPSNDRGLVIATRRGTPHRADNARTRHLYPLLKRLGIAPAGLHAFRHSLPAILASRGVGVAIVQRCMRHSTLRQTETYLHTNETDIVAAFDAAMARRASQTSAGSDTP